MKKRNTFLVIIISIVIFLLGIGYATITNIKLYIDGSASASKSIGDFSVVFDKKIPYINGGVTSAIIIGNDSAKLSVFLTEKNINGENYAVFKIKNNSEFISSDIKIDFVEQDIISKEYFNLYSKVDKSRLNPGEETNMKVYVDLKKVPNERVNSNFNINITASPVGE